MATNPSPTKYSYFVSSTYGDLAEFRKRVMLAVLKAQHIPAGMEEFAATDDRGWKIIQRTIDICDYYIVIVAGRYGTIDEETEEKISWTHKEYLYAREKSIPVLAFIRHNDHIKMSEAETDPKKQKKLNEFKNALTKSHLVVYWTDVDNLLYQISDSVPKAIEASKVEGNPRPGWYRGDSLPMNPAIAEELAMLSAENRKQRDANEKLQAQIAEFTATPPRLIICKEDGEEIGDTYSFQITEFGLKAKPEPYLAPGEIRAKPMFPMSGLTEVDPEELRKFLDRHNRSIELELCIENLGNRATDGRLDVAFRFESLEAVLIRYESTPDPPMMVVSAAAAAARARDARIDPSQHCYIDTWKVDDKGIGVVLERVKSISPGFRQSLSPFVITMQRGNLTTKCTCRVTDNKGVVLEKTFMITLAYKGKRMLSEKDVTDDNLFE